jgi:hypothetical protein
MVRVAFVCAVALLLLLCTVLTVEARPIQRLSSSQDGSSDTAQASLADELARLRTDPSVKADADRFIQTRPALLASR